MIANKEENIIKKRFCVVNNLNMFSIFCGCCCFLILLLLSVNAQYATKCLTSHEESGLCMPLKSCRNIYNIFEMAANNGNERLSERDMDLVQRSYCGTFNNVPYVCCVKSEIQLNIDGLAILTRTCGNRLVHRVSNGLVTTLYSFPWMALLKYNTGKLFQCGGSLISNRYVLTAAHCVKGQEGVLTHVRLGEYNISSDIDCLQNSILNCAPPVEDIEIEEFIIPDNYVLRGFHHDIALLRLNRPVVYNRNIKPICLPLKGVRRQSNDHYIISGWGGTEVAQSSNVLMAAVINAVNCSYAYPHLTYLNEGHICAGGENLIDSCRGDSGGPLGWRGTFAGHLRFIQYGIVSFGINSCGQKNVPGVYTNVSHYIQWITDHIKA